MTIFRLNFLLKVGQMKVCQNPSFISTSSSNRLAWFHFNPFFSRKFPTSNLVKKKKTYLIQLQPTFKAGTHETRSRNTVPGKYPNQYTRRTRRGS